MTTTVDLAALAASGQTKVTLLGGTITSLGSTGTDYAGFDDAAAVYVEVKVQLRDNSRGAAQLVLLLEGSADGNSWSTLETFTFTNNGTQTATVDTPNAHLRVTWTVARNTEWFIDHVTVAPASLNAPGGGGGGSQTLADVLAEGADTDGLEIVNVPDADDDAVVTRRATASGDGSALASSYAIGAGQGDGTAITSASAVDGGANVTRSAGSTTWAATADTNALGGDSTARANTTASTTGSGNAQVKNYAAVGGAGTATASITAADSDETHLVGIECIATASGQHITITGLPSSDPGVPGQLYISSGVLKISL